MKNYVGKKCIIRCKNAGVFFGEVVAVENTASGKDVTLRDVRKVWYWEGAAAVEQLSIDGCNDNSKLTVVVPEMTVMEAVQIIPCSDKAIKAMEELPVWKR